MRAPKPHPTLTHATLRELLHYEPITGVFTWKVSPSFNVGPGSRAGSIQGNGYRTIGILGVYVRCARLAWFYEHGAWPSAEIDHINRVCSDDRICNLRQASRGLNNQNRTKARVDSSTGIMGVSRRGEKWRAAIFVDGKIKHLGTHLTAEAAEAAYLAAKRLFHGRSS